MTIRRSRSPEYRIPPSVEPELEEAAARARKAGAPEGLDLIGVGMFGIVFCDETGRAWKVGRLQKPRPGEGGLLHTFRDPSAAWMRETLLEEYEWLRDAAKTPIAEHVAKVYAYHADQIVIERECVAGGPGGWSDGRILHDLHKKIETAMLQVGWTAPEFKEDSYIFRDRKPVLVDASMPLRIGENLAVFIEDVMAGRRTTKDRWHDLAFYLLREMQEKTVSRERALPLLSRLVELDQQIKHSFSW